MPLYVYRCTTCEKTFEKMMRWSESDHSPACPACQSQDTHKQISSFAALGSSSTSGGSSASSCGSGGGRFS